MSRIIPAKPFLVCYKTEVTSVIRGHHVYKEVWDATIGEMLEAASDDREEAREYDKYAVGLYKKHLLVGHIPIEVGLNKIVFTTNNKHYSEVLEKELLKRKTKFSALTLKFKQKGVYRKFPYYYTK